MFEPSLGLFGATLEPPWSHLAPAHDHPWCLIVKLWGQERLQKSLLKDVSNEITILGCHWWQMARGGGGGGKGYLFDVGGGDQGGGRNPHTRLRDPLTGVGGCIYTYTTDGNPRENNGGKI